jgi:response regulator NasT
MFKVLLFDDGSASAPLLREAALAAGCVIVGEEHNAFRLPAAIEALEPDAVLMDVESPGRDVLEQVVISTRHEPRPIVMFTADKSDSSIEAALQAGVSAYVVDGVDATRLHSILQVAMARFRMDQQLREKLDAAETRLAERKLIDRAKGLLMQHHKLQENDAYAAMRRAAMQSNLTLADVATNIIRAANLPS